MISRLMARLLTGPPGFLVAGAIDMIVFAAWLAARTLRRQTVWSAFEARGLRSPP